MTHIQQRRGTLAQWTLANPVLMDGEVGHEKDTGRWKLGDGVTPYISLPYKSGVDKVAGKTGNVSLVVDDVAGAAPLVDPAFTGEPTAPTPNEVDDSSRIATTAFVKSLDYADRDSPTLTGDPKAPTPPVDDADTSIATTAFVARAVMNRAPTTVPTGEASTLDYNTMTNAGWYVMDSTAPNTPSAAIHYLEVRSYGNNTEQVARSSATGAVYRRLRVSGTWQSWIPDDLTVNQTGTEFTLATGIITAGEGITLSKRGRMMTLQFYLRNNTGATVANLLTINKAEYRPTQTARTTCNGTSTIRSATLQPNGLMFLEAGGLTAGDICYGTMVWPMPLL